LTLGAKDVKYFESALSTNYFPKTIINISHILSMTIKAKSNEKGFEIPISIIDKFKVSSTLKETDGLSIH